MADTGENLRALIIADATVSATIGTRCYQNTVPSGAELPFVWFMRRGVGHTGVTGVEATPWKEYFDLECVAEGVDDAIDLANAVRSAIDGASGTLASGGTISWISVRDQADDYVVRNRDDDEKLQISSLDIEVTNP